jgi:hypothetical protein
MRHIRDELMSLAPNTEKLDTYAHCADAAGAYFDPEDE